MNFYYAHGRTHHCNPPPHSVSIAAGHSDDTPGLHTAIPRNFEQPGLLRNAPDFHHLFTDAGGGDFRFTASGSLSDFGLMDLSVGPG
jgi:hypothetical protein